jgi:dihydrodipicolinate synthase/N-acetylneuraminate lyase
VNVSHSSLPGAVQLSEHAFDAGASGVLLMPPYFYPYDAEEIASFYAAFFEATQDAGPVYLYSLPMCTTPIPAGLMRQLLGSGNFAGVKDSSGEWPVFEQLAQMRQELRFQLLVGNERVYVPGLLGGADGIISGVSAAVPELIVAIERAVRIQDKASVQTLSARLDEFMSWVGRLPVTAAIKAAADALRFGCRARWRNALSWAPCERSLSGQLSTDDTGGIPWCRCRPLAVDCRVFRKRPKLPGIATSQSWRSSSPATSNGTGKR